MLQYFCDRRDMIIYRRRTLFFVGLRMIKYYLLRNLEKETRVFDISYQDQQFVIAHCYIVFTLIGLI